GQWYSGHLMGGMDFVQWIALDQAGRPRDIIARDWIRTMKAAVRKHDTRHLITVGLLPPKEGVHTSGFVPETIAPELDFISVHIYPYAGKVDEAIAGLKTCAAGKPIVVEETFPLYCGAADMKKFLTESRGIAGGWIGHFHGGS